MGWLKSFWYGTAGANVREAIEKHKLFDLHGALETARLPDIGSNERRAWLKKAVDSGDIDIFNEVFSFLGANPNAMIILAGSGDRTWETSLLNYALKVRNHDVALVLADKADLLKQDIYDGRYTQTKLPFTAAMEGGMRDVAVILARRMAELVRQDAAQAAASWDKAAAMM